MNTLDRRRAILASLFVAPGFVLSSKAIQGALEKVHNVVATSSAIRADLIWLEEAGMVVTAPQDSAMLTERGQDVVLGRTILPAD